MRNKFITLIAGCLLSISASSQPLVFSGYDFNTIGSSYPLDMTVVGGNLFFSAVTTLGRELWVTDGFPNYGIMVKNIYPGSPGSDPASLAEFNGKLFFTANTGSGGGTSGIEIWTSDGTEAGTSLLYDIVPGSLSSNPDKFCIYNGRLYFSADTFMYGREIWSTDGTPQGTQRFKDINPRVSSCNFEYPVVFGGKLYFSAYDAINNQKLWYTNGTDTGTRRVLPITGGMAVNPMSLFVTGSKLYFIASTGGFPPSQPLYYTTGGSSGISVVSGIAPMQGFMADYNGELYLLGDSPVTGPELYKTNGASGSLVKEFYPGSGGTNLAWPCVYKNKLYFSAETAGEGKELWVTDGTAAGTTLVRDIITGTNGSAPMYLTVYKDHLYFAAQDTVGNYQVFRSDGTAAGTKMFQPATATEVSPLSNANGFRGFKEFKGALFYTANYTAAGSELWSLTDTSTPPIGIHTITTQNNDMVIYPNPNKGIFQIQFANTDFSFGTISIYDLMGRRVYSTVLNDHSKNLSVKPLLPAGVYQIRLQLDNTIISKKLLIE